MPKIQLVSSQEPTQQSLMAAAQGLIAQNFDRNMTSGVSTMIGGTAYGMLMPLYQGLKITNLFVNVATAGTAVTLFKAALLSSDGTSYIGKTEDKSSLFGSAGVKELPLTSQVTITKTGVYIVALVSTATTTLPQLWRSSTSANETKIGTSLRPYPTLGTGLSDLPAAPVTFGNNSPISYWVGAN